MRLLALLITLPALIPLITARGWAHKTISQGPPGVITTYPLKPNGPVIAEKDLWVCLISYQWAQRMNKWFWNDGRDCANHTFQLGKDHSTRTTFDVWDACLGPAKDAARQGRDWFKCDLRSRGISHAWLAYSPKGFKTCCNKDGSPCEVVDGKNPECKG